MAMPKCTYPSVTRACSIPSPLDLNKLFQVNQLNQLIELTRSELKRDDRQRIMSLITVDAHARDIVLMLIRENVTDKVGCVSFTTVDSQVLDALLPRLSWLMADFEARCRPTYVFFLIKLRASFTEYILFRLTFNGLLSSNNVSRESQDIRPIRSYLWRRSTSWTRRSSTASSF